MLKKYNILYRSIFVAPSYFRSGGVHSMIILCKCRRQCIYKAIYYYIIIIAYVARY
jgi:hypothetical protein